MLSILCVRLTIKVKVGIPESFKVGWYSPQKTGSSHLKTYTKFWTCEQPHLFGCRVPVRSSVAAAPSKKVSLLSGWERRRRLFFPKTWRTY